LFALKVANVLFSKDLIEVSFPNLILFDVAINGITYLRNGHQSSPNISESSMESDSEKGLLNGTETETRIYLRRALKEWNNFEILTKYREI